MTCHPRLCSLSQAQFPLEIGTGLFSTGLFSTHTLRLLWEVSFYLITVSMLGAIITGTVTQ